MRYLETTVSLAAGQRLGFEGGLRRWGESLGDAPNVRDRLMLQVAGACHDLMRGDLSHAGEASDRILRDFQAAQLGGGERLLHYASGLILWVARERDRPLDAEANLRQRIALHPSMEIWRSVLTLILFESGQTEAARSELQAAEDRGFDRIARDGRWALTLSFYAVVAAELEVASAAKAIHRLLTPVAHQHITAMMTAQYHGTVRRVLGYLEASLGRVEPAIQNLERAISEEKAMGATLSAAYASIRLAQVLCETEDGRVRAEELFDEVESFARTRHLARLTRLVSSARDELPSTRRVGQPSPDRATFRRNGDAWVIGCEGEEQVLMHSRGFEHLHFLLSNPGMDHLALDVAQAGGGDGDKGLRIPSETRGAPLLDRRARGEIRQRARQLKEQIEEAEARRDSAGVANARTELDALERAILKATQPSGRARHASSNVERARVNVTRNIKRAIQTIAAESPCLRQHLENRVQTGRLCNYAPDEYAPMEFDLGT